MQGSGGVDYDIGAYAGRLRAILERKVATTAALLERVVTFQRHLAIEEEVSKKVEQGAMSRVL